MTTIKVSVRNLVEFVLPSYDYLQEVYLRFREQNQQVKMICQTPGMAEEERESFLESFAANPRDTLIGFADGWDLR